MAETWHAGLWKPEFLVRRIDRCYLIAAGARVREKREYHLERARFYRRMLGRVVESFA